jgi:hypothetical protein
MSTGAKIAIHGLSKSFQLNSGERSPRWSRSIWRLPTANSSRS